MGALAAHRLTARFEHEALARAGDDGAVEEVGHLDAAGLAGALHAAGQIHGWGQGWVRRGLTLGDP